ncbi:MAG: hypothetical protein WGN25_09030 [Candidatus Electrothrix sp. GW3-4]|uniref:hypothetical protein n=1 Tax=Candidatus Electrothrix sp. GW3-4 TaxID=3126740 RepID=UPI0030CEE509
MECKEIREKAEALGLNSEKKSKRDLIHAIQLSEGNVPCFRTKTDFCDQTHCCWRDDCLSPHWREGALLEEVKTELEGLIQTFADLKATTNKLAKKKKKNTSKQAWKKTQKNIESSWKEIGKALQKLTARF